MDRADNPQRTLRDPGRLAALHRSGLLDTPAEESFDRLTRLAARFLNAPVAMMNLIGEDRQFCKSQVGLPEPLASNPVLPLEYSFCRHVVDSGGALVVEDAATHPLVRDNRATLEFGAAAYVGIPLATGDGKVLGSLCVFDREPRCWADDEVQTLRDLAGSVMAEIELRMEITERQMTEVTLRESEARFRLMVEGSEQVFFYIHDTEHRFEYLSPSVRNVLGYDPGELIGRPYDLVLAGDASDALVHRYTDSALSAGGGLATYIALTRHKDGRTVPIELVETPVERGGAVVGMQGFARDITDRRNSEEELLLQRASLEQLFESAPEAIVMLDNEHHVIRVNSEFTRIFGYTLPEVQGRALDEVIVAPDRHDEAADLTRRVMGGATVGMETVRRRKDGSSLHVSILSTPIRVGGSQVAVYGIYRDITDRKQAEMKLSAAEVHYRRLVESSPYGIYALDAEGRFTEVNRAVSEILQRPVDEVVGRYFTEFIAPEELDRAVDQFRRRVAGEIPENEFELRVVRPSGERRLVRINASVAREGAEVAVHSVARDVTIEYWREAQLRRAERLATVGTLVGGVAHELNNPLTSVKSFAELMLMDERSAEDRESLEIIRREADRAAKIVADLRLLARQTRADNERVRTVVDLNEVVRHVLKVRRYAMETHNVEIREVLEDGLPAIVAVCSEIEQVVLNLVINAEHAMLDREGERVLTLRTASTQSGVSLNVADSGIGIRTEDLDRIFDPFWTTKEPGVGTGLGLSVVHGIMTEHGGTIRVESVPGRGSAFLVELPCVPDVAVTADIAESGEKPATEPAQPVRSLRVLVVDDEEGIRSSLTRYLARRGHRVDEAAEGREALARIDAAASGEGDGAEYDIILADLRMPGLGGDQLLNRLRERGRGWDDKLIFVTGDAVSADAAQLLSAANVPVILKPFALDRVANLVERHVAERWTTPS